MAKKKNKERGARAPSREGAGATGASDGRGKEAEPTRQTAEEADLARLLALLASPVSTRLFSADGIERIRTAAPEAVCYVMDEVEWMHSPEGVVSLVLEGELHCLSADGRHRFGVCLAGTFPEALARRPDGEPTRSRWIAERRCRLLEVRVASPGPWRRRDTPQVDTAWREGATSAQGNDATLPTLEAPSVSATPGPRGRADILDTAHRSNERQETRGGLEDDSAWDDDRNSHETSGGLSGRERSTRWEAMRAATIVRGIFRSLRHLLVASGLGSARSKLGALLLAAGLSALFLVLLPLYSRYLVDVVILHGELWRAPWVVGGMVLTGALGLACALVRDRFLAWLLGSFQLLTLVAFAARVHGLPLTGLWARGEGRILQLHEEARHLFEQMAGRVVTLLIGGVQFSLQLLIVALIDVRFLVITIALLSAAVAAVAVVSRAASFLSAGQRFAEERRVQLMHEQLEAQEWIHSTRSLTEAYTRWEHACYEASRASSRLAFLHALLQHAGAFAQRAVGAFLLFLGLYLHQRGELTLGQVVALAFVSDQALKPALHWLRDWRYLVETPVTLSRIAHFLSQDGTSSRDAAEQEEARTARAWTATFDAGTTPVQIVASATVGLRERFAYELAFSGAGGSYVSSDVPVFSGSLLDNVALGAEEPDAQRAVAALRVCELGSLVEGRVRGGLEASLKGVAGMLTERERIQLALARCVYFGKDRIVIDGAFDDFDTPTWQRLTARMRLAVPDLTLCIFTATEPPPAALAGAGFHRASSSRRERRPEEGSL